MDRIKRSLERIVGHFLSGTDYHALYPATVVQQVPSGLLEVRPDDSRLPGMVNVPIRFGIPGVSARIRQGSRVLIGFEHGDPRSPIATVWESASLESVTIQADAVYLGQSGGNPIARVGDVVECVFPAAVPVSGTLSGAPFTGFLTIVNTVSGLITSGSEKVMAV